MLIGACRRLYDTFIRPGHVHFVLCLARDQSLKVRNIFPEIAPKFAKQIDKKVNHKLKISLFICVR